MVFKKSIHNIRNSVIRQIFEGVRVKNLEATYDFSKAFYSILRGKMKQILAYSLPKETVAAIMMLYKNTKVKVCSPDGDTDFLILSQVYFKEIH